MIHDMNFARAESRYLRDGEREYDDRYANDLPPDDDGPDPDFAHDKAVEDALCDDDPPCVALVKRDLHPLVELLLDPYRGEW